MATTKVERIMVELGLDSYKFSADVDKAIQKNRELDKALSTTEKTAQQAAKMQSELVKKYQYSTEELASFLQDMTRLKEQLSQLLNVIAEKTSLNKLAGDATKLLDQLGKSSEIITNWQKAFSSFGTSTQDLTTALNNIKKAMNGLVEFGNTNMSPYLLSFVSEMNDSKLSVDSLNTAFIHLAKTVKNDVMPELFNYSIVIDKLKLDNQSVKLENNQQIIKNRLTTENHIPAGSIKSQSLTRSKTQVASKTSAQNKTPPISKESTRNKTPVQQKIPVESKTSTQNKTSIQNTAPTLGKTPTSNKVPSVKITPNTNNIKGSENIADKARKAADYATKHALPRSNKDCAKYVNRSFRAQGINVWGHGKDVAKNLIATGKFQSIPYSKDYVPQIGDVMSLPAGLGQNATAGHVAIWNGRYWVSDFVQKNTRGNTAATSDESYQNIVKGVSVPTIARMVNPSAKQAVTKPVQTAVTQKPSSNRGATSQTNNGQWPAFKTEFVKKFYSAAVAVSKGLKGVISPEGILAQWALETGWGRKITPGTGYNIGNHKADIYWKGAKTKDKILDKRTGRRDHYRIYTEQDLVKESIKFLSTKRYAAVWSAKTEYEALMAMEKAGYAEGKNYANTIMRINKDIKAHAKSIIMVSRAHQAQRMVVQNQLTKRTISKNGNQKNVNVHIQNINVKTSANTVSGNAVAALKEAHNYLFNQLGTSVT